jgi:simple sugar transport system ATP-binding protein
MQSESRGGAPAPLLDLIGITKRFGDLVANDRIDLDVYPGEVHALLGENGAGKTTLMNILYGLYHPDAGQIELRGQPVHIASPHQAIQLRIGMVHQHFMLVPNFTVVENLILGLPVEGAPYLDLKRAAGKVSELAERYGMQVDPYALVGDLPVGVQQRVEILKTLYRGAELLILDEPTAVLTPLEVSDFFGVLKNLVAHGLSVIFISHKLNEVLEVSNRITVLRRGRKIGTLPTSEATLPRLAEMMVGREVILQTSRPPAQPGPVLLEAQELQALNNQGQPALKNLSLQVRAGEILGIAGVDGNGQQELADVLNGLRPLQSGRILVKGQDLTGRPAADFILSGVAFIPADRHEVGLVLDFTIADNLVLKRTADPAFARYGVLNGDAIQDFSGRAIQNFDIRAASSAALARQLSGGNQQKVILAREIESAPAVLIAMHPTRGLDIGAMEYVQNKLLEQRAKGVAVLLISTELEELLALSDRIAVMFRGEIMGEVPGDPSSLDQIARMMLGQRMEAPDVLR